MLMATRKPVEGTVGSPNYIHGGAGFLPSTVGDKKKDQQT